MTTTTMPATATTGSPAMQTILVALTTHPDCSAVDLAAITGLGRSTVAKHLATLERAGAARRSPGGHDGRLRRPDHWACSPSEPTAPPTAPQSKPVSGATRPDERRLRSGELDTLVLNHITTTAGSEPQSPATVAKALGRSSGAVANCLARLTATGRLQLLTNRPRRYLPPV
jgi:biotin operon repressor